MASITKKTTELKETTSYDKKLITCLNCVQIGPETDALHEHLRGRFAKKKNNHGAKFLFQALDSLREA